MTNTSPLKKHGCLKRNKTFNYTSSRKRNKEQHRKINQHLTSISFEEHSSSTKRYQSNTNNEDHTDHISNCKETSNNENVTDENNDNNDNNEIIHETKISDLSKRSSSSYEKQKQIRIAIAVIFEN